MLKVDIIIPIKNEAKNLSLLTERINTALDKENITYRIIFIDDHSTDKTLEIIQELSSKYPVTLQNKQGKPGKAWSIIQGASLATSEVIVMMDADLQYPPEAIPKMLALTQKYGVVVANRKKYQGTYLRKVLSRTNSFIFGRLLFGLRCDVQSGLKLFRRDIIPHIDTSVVTPWTLDIPLLFTALELGYKIGSVDIVFHERWNGHSKINLIKTAWEISHSALKLRSRKRRIYQLPPNEQYSMFGAGIVHKRKRFITHTTLAHHLTALETFKKEQIFFIAFLLGIATGGLILNPLPTAILIVGILSAVYFLDVFFNLYLVIRSLNNPPEIEISDAEVDSLDSRTLPVYSILCPLYKEAHIIPQFLDSINKLDWPKNKLDVLLLLEADDNETISAVEKMQLPNFVNVAIVPDSLPKTKPKACNYGLALVTGEFVVIYDAEDKPDPLQLKKAFLGFQKISSKVICLQAKLNYYNPHHNLLTRLFTAEYSFWFDLVLPGLQSLNTSIPLGGTSNHFRTQSLHQLRGWDPFNVTEDADLGVRLFKQGFQTAIINSTTLEEANSQSINWLRQRSRWIKGYMQTYFVHMRQPFKFVSQYGIHAFIFQLLVGGKIAFMLINPFLWLATFSYFAFYAVVGPSIEAVYPSVVFYMAATSLIFGNFLCMYYYMIACAKREQWTVVKFVFLVPLYWLMVSAAAFMALLQLIFKPHYWEKTHHGFHLQKQKTISSSQIKFAVSGLDISTVGSIRQLFKSRRVAGGFLVFASLVGNIFGFLFNAYLVRHVSIEEFGLVSLFGSFLFLASVPVTALSKTVTHRSAYLLGKYESPVREFWAHIRKHIFYISLIFAGVWTLAIPLLVQIFHTSRLIPFILFIPVWPIGLLAAVNVGYISGNLRFVTAAFLIIAESLSKLLITMLLVNLELTPWIYIAIPLSMTISLLLGWWAASTITNRKIAADPHTLTYFPKGFLLSSVMTKISDVSYLSMDVILAKLFLSPQLAGEYAVLSLSGKMIYFLGSLFTQFITPIVSRNEGAGKNSQGVFNRILVITTVASTATYVALGIFGNVTAPLLFGKSAQLIVQFLPFYGLGFVYFTIASSIVAYHQVKKRHVFPLLSLFLAIFQIFLIVIWHNSIAQITYAMLISGIAYLVMTILVHLTYDSLATLTRNWLDFLGLFAHQTINPVNPQKLRVLIFNWRDIKHIWAGGAETYIQEISKEWVKNGHQVTIFCGNDGKSARNDKVDGVSIVRRGGFYTVYFWAMLYYLLRFRGKFDVVIDSINGMPFFTPLYIDIPSILLIHHVHQQVFRKHLIFPLSIIAMFIEAKLIPWIYHGHNIITVSESSKKEILKHKLSSSDLIDVVSPGIDPKMITVWPKTIYPSFLYLGRLKPYKNVDVAINALAQVLKQYSDTKLTIAGDGESLSSLQKLVKKLNLANAVSFVGRVSEKEKSRLLGESWALIHPSSIEGWGITVIEANAKATPVIASNVGGLKDSVVNQKTGLLVQVKNVYGFAKAMNSLISQRGIRNSMSKEALLWSQQFSWEKSAQTFKEIIFNTLIQRNRKPFVGQMVVAKD